MERCGCVKGGIRPVDGRATVWTTTLGHGLFDMAYVWLKAETKRNVVCIQCLARRSQPYAMHMDVFNGI